MRYIYSNLGHHRFRGLSVAKILGLPFIQEVVAGARATQKYIPQADVVLELGGEDAKITYMKPSLEQRMNGTCAGARELL